jgi:formylglycine-generating enzyme required for sulfatase activity
MFSQAGNPWTRALVRDVTSDSLKNDWSDKKMDQLPGRQFAMDSVGVNQNDLANFISKNKKWSNQQIQGLRKYFQEKLDDQALLVFKVRGEFSEEFPDSVAINYEPYIYFSSDTTILNPKLSTEQKVPDNL